MPHGYHTLGGRIVISKMSVQSGQLMRILVADDHLLFTDMLEEFLGKLDDITVDKAPTFREVASKAEGGMRYDMVILDVGTPGMNGLDGLVRARRYFPDTPIAIMSGKADPRVVGDAMRLGATGFMPKTMRGAAMINAIQLMMSGDRYVPGSVLPDIERPQSSDPAGIDLTQRELEVMGHVKAGHANKRIAADLNIAPVTVALHLRRIYKKLGAANRTDAVRILTERGRLAEQ